MHLQNLLERNWKLEPGDSDKIVMVHRVVATSADQNKHEFISSFVIEGKDAKYTAMSKTVGMPIAFAVKRLLDGELKNRGVLLPTLPEIYEPILSDLKSIGISFVEKEMSCVND